MAAQSSLKNMALCLAGVCLFCSAVLGVVYAVTLEPIKIASNKALVESIGRVLPEGLEISEAQQSGDYQYYTGSSNGVVAGYAVKSSVIGFGGPLTVMVGVLSDGTVFNTSVLSHSETPGLGAKCQSDEAFMGQWRGFSPDKVLKVKKDGGDVDAITASTITSRAYALAVANAVELVQSLAAGESVSVEVAQSESEQNEKGGQSNE